MKHKAYKVTDPNGLSFESSKVDGTKLQYTVGKITKLSGCNADEGQCGHGIHLAPTLHQTLKWSKNTAFTTARFFECEYDEKHILGKGDDKVRVSRCKVIREVTLEEMELPNTKRVLNVIKHVQKLNDKKYDTYDESKIVSHTLEHIRRTIALDKESRNLDITAIRMHGAEHLASVWDSVWDSVWASVVMDDDKNYGIPSLDCILEGGGHFLGVDKDGVAHVIVPTLKGFKDVKL